MYNENQPKQEINLLAILFVFLQLIFIVAFTSLIVSALQKSDEVDGENQTQIVISNIDEAVPDLPRSALLRIQTDLGEKVNAVAKTYSLTTTAEIRLDTVMVNYLINSADNFVSAVVDIPELEQSYRLYFKYDPDEEANAQADDEIDYHDISLVLCLRDDDEVIYPNFSCNNEFDKGSLQYLASRLIGSFEFNDFAVAFDEDDSSLIKIWAYDEYNVENDDAFLEELQIEIEKYGISPDIFNYYIIKQGDLDFTYEPEDW